MLAHREWLSIWPVHCRGLPGSGCVATRRCYKNHMLMKQTVCLATLLMLHFASRLDAQGMIPVTGTVEREIAAGTAHSYTIQLTDGEYVAGVVVQRGIAVVATIYEPSGSRVRNFTAPREGRITFTVAADQSGTYRLELRAPAVSATQGATGSYQLSLTEKLSLDERLKPTLPEERYKSRTIEELHGQLAKGDADTERFWRTVRQSGAPLVEAIDGDPSRMLVTFLWRGNNSTRSVGVWGIVFGGPPSDYQMRHLSNSDVWYLTLRLPAGSRFTYGFSPNAPVGPEFGSPRFQQRVATMQRDPWNPLREPGCPADATRYECPSMAELPGAASQSWIVPNPSTPSGKIERHTFKSDILKNERAISVYMPPGYRADGAPSALLVVLDGPAYFRAGADTDDPRQPDCREEDPSGRCDLRSECEWSPFEGAATKSRLRRVSGDRVAALGPRPLHRLVRPSENGDRRIKLWRPCRNLCGPSPLRALRQRAVSVWFVLVGT